MNERTFYWCVLEASVGRRGRASTASGRARCEGETPGRVPGRTRAARPPPSIPSSPLIAARKRPVNEPRRNTTQTMPAPLGTALSAIPRLTSHECRPGLPNSLHTPHPTATVSHDSREIGLINRNDTMGVEAGNEKHVKLIGKS